MAEGRRFSPHTPLGLHSNLLCTLGVMICLACTLILSPLISYVRTL